MRMRLTDSGVAKGRAMKSKPGLSGVPETMLWTLHNRWSEARKPGGLLSDPRCVEIHEAIDFDYELHFGPGEPSHALRSLAFDRELRRFSAAHPGPFTIVNLGEGLETQRYRLADLPARWYSVDLAPATEIRERYIAPDADHVHLTASVLSETWCERIPPGPVHLTAQGLLMYLPPEEIAPLLSRLAERFPGAWFSFDTIPGWLSRKTLRGAWQLSAAYTPPRMPFGVSRRELPRLARGAVGADVRVQEFSWGAPWSRPRWVAFGLARNLPWLGRYLPAMWTLEFPGEARA